MTGMGSGLHPVTRQRGVAGMAAMMFLLVVVAFSAVTLLNMAGSDLHDTTAQNDSAAALFLAESGVERALQLYNRTATCDASLLQPVVANFGLRGSVEPNVNPVTGLPVQPVVVTPSSCRIEVRGRVTNSNTLRTIRAVLQRGPVTGNIAFINQARSNQGGIVNTLIWNHAIPAGPGIGSNRILVVGVAIRRTAGQSVVFGAQTTYNGVPMTSVGAVTDATNGLRIEWMYALNPPVGGNPQIRVRLNPNARAVGISMVFSGVEQAPPTPVDAVSAPPPACNGNYPANPACTVTTLTNNARVVDMLAVRLTATAAPANPVLQPLANSFAAGNGVNGIRGAASYRAASTSPAGPVAMNWVLTPGAPPAPPFTNAWLQSALALKPVPLAHVVTWNEL